VIYLYNSQDERGKERKIPKQENGAPNGYVKFNRIIKDEIIKMPLREIPAYSARNL
jgi:hypothetical protein